MFYMNITKEQVYKAIHKKQTKYTIIDLVVHRYLWFYVPVEDFSIMYMLQCQANLYKPIQNLGKRKQYYTTSISTIYKIKL